MKRSSATRRFALTVVLALVLAALVLPATPAAADANDYWSMTSSPVTVRRDGVDYKMSISVSESSTFEIAQINLFKRSNPAGVASAQQNHGFFMDVKSGNNRFTHPEINLSRARFNAGNEFGQYGTMDLRFTADRTLKKTCNGHLRTRGGKLSGTVNFKTGTAKFGTITVRPTRALLFFDDGDCPGGGGTGGNACPSRSRSIYAGREAKPMSITGYKIDGADTASVIVDWTQPLKNKEGSLSHQVLATLPASKFTVGNTATTGTIEGVRGTWLSGKATYTASEGSTFTSAPQNCGGDKEYVNKSSFGTLTGRLKADFFLGPDRAVNDARMEYAGAQRYIVRLR